MSETKLERRIEFRPAYDKRAEGYGIHCCEMRWYLSGPAGIVQFVLFTGWYLKQPPGAGYTPIPADIGYHSHMPRYAGQESGECHLLPEGRCYYDRSSLQADDAFRVLIEKGDDALWKCLEGYYEVRLKPNEVAA